MSQKIKVLVSIIIFVIMLVAGRDILRGIKHTLAFAELGYVYYVQKGNSDYPLPPDSIAPATIVAHGGGHVDTLGKTNSIAAMNESYRRGIRFIELDFEWTSDKQLVCIHDWKRSWKSYFGGALRIPTRQEFVSSAMRQNLGQMDLSALDLWIHSHRDCKIITDIKRKNLFALETIKKEFPDLMENIIPQIYWFHEYRPVKSLGYKNVILTLYKANYWDAQVLFFVKHFKVFAVTIYKKRALSRLAPRLSAAGVFVYVNSVNSIDEFQKLKNNGVHGIYSDTL